MLDSAKNISFYPLFVTDCYGVKGFSFRTLPIRSLSACVHRADAPRDAYFQGTAGSGQGLSREESAVK